MNRLQQQKTDGGYVEPSKATVAEYLDMWIENGKGEWRPWTFKGYSALVRVHIIPRIGYIPLQQLTQDHIKAMYRDIRINGYSKGRSSEHIDELKKFALRYSEISDQIPPRARIRKLVEEFKRPESTMRYWIHRCEELGLLNTLERQSKIELVSKRVSPKTVHNIHIALRAALNDAMNTNLIRTNPARGALRPPKWRKVMKTWTVEELRVFLEFVKPERNFALYRLAAQSGMRRGELLGLKWSNIKFQANSISIQQQLTGLEKEEEEFENFDDLSPTKSAAGYRAVSLDSVTMAALSDHRLAQEFERRSWADGYEDNELVFCRANGSPYDPDSITGEFEKLARKAAIKQIRLHDLRHTHATLLLEAHVDITVVSKRLGHASVKTTADLYAHVTARLQEDAALRIGTLVDGGG
ncbi:MAG: tyrosine-type recombinase/integrase [Candidatus Dormibacteraceae bacterium]